jgi:hypothetical protein
MTRPLVCLSLVAALVASACREDSAVVEPAGEQTTYDVDLLEAVFRYQLQHNESNGTALQRANFYVLSCGEDEDPPAELMERFAEHSPPVELRSSVTVKGTGVTHQERGERGVLLKVETIRWIDSRTVEVDGGYFEGGASASGATYRVESRGEVWNVVDKALKWMS